MLLYLYWLQPNIQRKITEVNFLLMQGLINRCLHFKLHFIVWTLIWDSSDCLLPLLSFDWSAPLTVKLGEYNMDIITMHLVNFTKLWKYRKNIIKDKWIRRAKWSKFSVRYHQNLREYFFFLSFVKIFKTAYSYILCFCKLPLGL